VCVFAVWCFDIIKNAYAQKHTLRNSSSPPPPTVATNQFAHDLIVPATFLRLAGVVLMFHSPTTSLRSINTFCCFPTTKTLPGTFTCWAGCIFRVMGRLLPVVVYASRQICEKRVSSWSTDRIMTRVLSLGGFTRPVERMPVNPTSQLNHLLVTLFFSASPPPTADLRPHRPPSL
jgi:hypothetical protein